MQSIISELYNGEIYPSETICLKTEEYRKAYQVFDQACSILKQELPDDKHKLLEEVIDTHAAVEDLNCQAFYREGLITGIRLMMEVMEA